MNDTLVQQVAATLKAGGPGPSSRVTVGLSGGIDSVVLLHVLRRGLRWSPQRISAIHINHQISQHAASWATHCRRYCRTLGVNLKVVKVEVPRGNSTEAAARAARLGVFVDCNADVVALAHNRDDQAETLMLQLLRGAGPRGLAAMPQLGSATPALWRPLLEVPRSAIENYARHHQLAWVEDDSNLDRAYLRNFLRHDVLPLIEKKVPAAKRVLARAARLQAEASDLLDILAVQDIGGHAADGCIETAALAGLPAHRARNALRYFLRSNGVTMPEAGRLDELLRQSLTARDDARVCVDMGDVELRRFRGALHIVRPLPPVFADFEKVWCGRRPLKLPLLGGVLRFERCQGDGIAAGWFQRGVLTVRVRGGGEGLRLIAGGPRRTVRNLLQEAGVPPWRRERLPMLYLDQMLAAVPGVGVDERLRPPAGAAGWRPVWRPD